MCSSQLLSVVLIMLTWSKRGWLVRWWAVPRTSWHFRCLVGLLMALEPKWVQIALVGISSIKNVDYTALPIFGLAFSLCWTKVAPRNVAAFHSLYSDGFSLAWQLWCISVRFDLSCVLVPSGVPYSGAVLHSHFLFHVVQLFPENGTPSQM